MSTPMQRRIRRTAAGLAATAAVGGLAGWWLYDRVEFLLPGITARRVHQAARYGGAR